MVVIFQASKYINPALHYFEVIEQCEKFDIFQTIQD